MSTLAEPDAQIIDTLLETVSPSRLSSFQGCRLRFYFRHVLRLKKPKTAALHLGSSVHAVLKSWNRARWRQERLAPGDLYATYEALWIEGQQDEPVNWESVEQEGSQKQTGWRLLETFFRESPIRDAGRPDAVECRVEADLGSGFPRLVGVLDLVQRGSSSTSRPAGPLQTLSTPCWSPARKPRPTLSCTGRTPGGGSKGSSFTTWSSSSSPAW